MTVKITASIPGFWSAATGKAVLDVVESVVSGEIRSSMTPDTVTVEAARWSGPDSLGWLEGDLGDLASERGDLSGLSFTAETHETVTFSDNDLAREVYEDHVEWCERHGYEADTTASWVKYQEHLAG